MEYRRLRYELLRPENAVINRTFGFADFWSQPAAEAAARLDELQQRPAFAGQDPQPAGLAKVSGLYPPGSSWTAGDLKEVAEFAFGLFGPDRLMFGSDWPVAELSGGYAQGTDRTLPALRLPPA